MIHVVIGTKAQLIKIAPVLKAFKANNIDYNYISTGQHKATIDHILANFNIKKPDYTLYEGKDITSIFQMFIWLIGNIFKILIYKEKVFKNDKNGVVLVHGDTISTLLGAIMGKLAGLKVAHVESGLRSFNLFHPFPEEIIRILTFKLSDYMFYPNDWAGNNLKKYKSIKINTGTNTLYDALKIALPAIKNISDIDIPDKKYGIVSLHRFENIYNYKSFNRIMSIVKEISDKKYLLFILHKPTEKKLKAFGFYQNLAENTNIELRKRYDYFKFIKLVLEAEFIVSDGGSNQEECHYLGKPIILLRKATERNEGIDENCVLSQYDSSKINEFINNIDKYKFDIKELPFSPSEIIVKELKIFA